jgi:hypothetical protein
VSRQCVDLSIVQLATSGAPESVLRVIRTSDRLLASAAIEWSRQYECSRIDELVAALGRVFGSGAPAAGFAVLINKPNQLMFYARWQQHADGSSG